MQRFRWMGLYVVVVAMALGCAVLVVALTRAPRAEESGMVEGRMGDAPDR